MLSPKMSKKIEVAFSRTLLNMMILLLSTTKLSFSNAWTFTLGDGGQGGRGLYRQVRDAVIAGDACT